MRHKIKYIVIIAVYIVLSSALLVRIHQLGTQQQVVDIPPVSDCGSDICNDLCQGANLQSGDDFQCGPITQVDHTREIHLYQYGFAAFTVLTVIVLVLTYRLDKTITKKHPWHTYATGVLLFALINVLLIMGSQLIVLHNNRVLLDCYTHEIQGVSSCLCNGQNLDRYDADCRSAAYHEAAQNERDFEKLFASSVAGIGVLLVGNYLLYRVKKK